MSLAAIEAELKPKVVETFEVVLYPGDRPRIWLKFVITATAHGIAYQCDRLRSFLGGCPTLDDPRIVPLGTGRPAPSKYRA